MPNEQIIDSVIDPVVKKQIDDTALQLAQLDKQFIDTAKSANLLNAATGNVKSFSDYNKAVKESAINEEKLNQLRAKGAAAEQARQQKAIADSQRKQAQSDKETASINKQSGAYAQLKKSFDEATTAARNAGVTFGKSSEEFAGAAAHVKNLRGQLDDIDKPLGNFQRNVGNYGSAIIDGFGSVYNIIRKVAYALPGVGIGTIFLAGFEGLKYLVQELGFFNSTITTSEIKAKAFGDAINNTDYSKAIQDVTELGVNLKLAQDGFLDKDHVIDEYNKTLGKTTGYVDTLNEAEAAYNKNAKEFIRITLLKAAAESIASEAAKAAIETATKNQKLQDDIDELNTAKANAKIAGLTNKNGIDVRGTLIAAEKDISSDIKQIQKNNDELTKANNRRIEVLTRINQQQAIADKNQGGIGTDNSSAGEGNGATAIATLRNSIANIDLENQKIKAQQIENNQKNSYDTRIKAAKDYYSASYDQLNNNRLLETTGIKLTFDQQEEITRRFNNDVLNIQIDRDKKVQAIRDERQSDAIAVSQERIKREQDVAKAIYSDQTQNFQKRLEAIGTYKDKSIELSKTQAEQELYLAGQNAEKVTKIKLQAANREVEIGTNATLETAKIQKEVSDQLKKQLEDLLNGEKNAMNGAIAILQDGSDQQLNALKGQQEKELAILDDKYGKGKISQRKYNRDRLKIDNEFAIASAAEQLRVDQAILAAREATSNRQIADLQGNASPEDIARINKDLDIPGAKKAVASDRDKLNNPVIKGNKDDASDKAKIAAAAEQAIATALDLAQKAIDASYQHQIDLLEQKRKLLDDNSKAEIEGINNSIASEKTKQREINVINARAAQQNKQIDAEERNLKRQQAEFDKEASIAKIIQQGAAAVVSALDNPYPLNIVLAAITGATVAAELAVAIATPLPSFAKGGKTKGGNILWGEAGTEMATLPDGSRKVSTGATIEAFPAGTMIMPHMQLMSMIRPSKVDYVGGEQIGWKEVVKAVNANKPEKQRNRIIVNVDTGYEVYKSKYLKR